MKIENDIFIPASFHNSEYILKTSSCISQNDIMSKELFMILELDVFYVIIKVFMYFISLVTSFLRYICKIFLSFYGFNKIIFIIQYSSDIPLFSMCTAFISKDKLCTLLLEMLSKFTLSYYGPSKNITTNIDAQN